MATPVGQSNYAPVEDPEKLVAGPQPPEHWQAFAKGAGQCEYQGFESWTPEEQALFWQGKLRCKWGIGQVSVRLPVQDTKQFLALLYGYLPFIIPIWWAIWAICSAIVYGSPRFFPVFGLAIAGGFALVNELITKQICKRTLPPSITSRPPEAVCKHPGMPSGHVMNAWTLMVWCLLEAALEDSVHPEWLAIICLVLGPVPWARVYNKDHTFAQVTASAIAAIFMGGIAFYIRKSHYPNHHALWDWYVATPGIENQFTPDFN